MRPINLIPEEERPGGRRPLRAGPLAYVVVGVLALALIGLTALVVTDGQVSDSEAEVAKLESEVEATTAEAQALSAYTQFHSVREQRLATMTSLADSRFDWPRVMHELSLVLPTSIWVTNLTGSVSPDSGGGGSGIGLRAGIAGPALEISGCAINQAAVGGFVDALEGIDGATRVGLQSSALGTGSTGSESTSSASCEDESLAQFQLVVGFDAAPVPTETSGEAPATPEVSAEAASEEASPEEGEEEEATIEEGEG